jgi:hypothetical protein
MGAMQFHQSLPGDLAQPGIKGNRPALDVLWQPLERLGKRLLHHVRRVDACGNPRVQMHGHHAPQTGPMAGQQLLGGRAISAGDLLQELVRVWIVSGH